MSYELPLLDGFHTATPYNINDLLRNLVEHALVSLQMMLPIHQMDKVRAQDPDALLIYYLDDSVQLVNASGDMLVELDSLNRFVHGVL